MYSDYYSYDIETLKNLFTCHVIRHSDKAHWKFEISPWKHQGYEMYLFFCQVGNSGGVGVGYNNLFFDYPVMHVIMERQGQVSVDYIYRYAQQVIRDSNAGNPWNHVVWDNEMYFPQIDLMKVHHFDNKAKMTSLKLLEFNMLMHDIQEMPIHHATEVKPEQTPFIHGYNHHDVKATDMFLGYTLSMLETRYELSKKFNRNFVNFNDTKIGEQITVETLKKSGVHLKKGMKTVRTKIPVGEILFDYLEFTRPEFQQIHEFFKSAVIEVDRIKGFFGSRDKSKSKCQELISRECAEVMKPEDVTVLLHSGKSMTYVKYLKTPEIHHPDDKFKPVNVHCIVDGFRFDFGAGGIHGSLHNTVVRSDENVTLFDSDVASYYPNIAIENKIFPAHIGPAWCDAMNWMYHERLRVGKKTDIGNGFKLALNGSYGKSSDEHSVLYDPQYTMSITINGQLMLCMLAEALMDAIPDFKMVQVNTDGLSYTFPPEYREQVMEVHKWWETVTQLELEHVDYRLMAIRDVNNYLAVTKPYKDDEGKLKPGKVKRIGAYAYVRAGEDSSTRELPWHKNHSAVVVAKAAEAALVRNVNIETFIRNHLTVNPWDFYLRAKVPRTAELLLETTEMWGGKVVNVKQEQLPNITRFYVSKTGGKLIKKMEPTELKKQEWLTKPHWRHIKTGETKQSKRAPSGMWRQVEPPTKERPPTETGIVATRSNQWLITVANTIHDEPDLTGVDVSYYVSETRKLVDELVST